jgi:hypothetical protein
VLGKLRGNFSWLTPPFAIDKRSSQAPNGIA